MDAMGESPSGGKQASAKSAGGVGELDQIADELYALRW
jgi:hypothetical protein